MSLVVWDKAHFKSDEPTRHSTAKARKAEADALWRATCKAVDTRDGKACRACDKRSDPEATGLLARGHRHHLVYRSAGGPDTPENLVTLCAECHAAEHANRLRIEGTNGPANANDGLIFFRKDDEGCWFQSRRELAVRVLERD